MFYTFLEFYCMHLYGIFPVDVIEVYSVDYIAVYTLYTRNLPCVANVVYNNYRLWRGNTADRTPPHTISGSRYFKL